jgi:hypothetical protein
LQNFNAFGGGARRDSQAPALHVPTWMTGTSPVISDRTVINQWKVLT